MDAAGVLEALRGEFPSPKEFEARVRADYDRNYICFFGLGTAAAGWIRHWCTAEGIEVLPQDVREDLASRLLGWARCSSSGPSAPAAWSGASGSPRRGRPAARSPG